MQFVVYRMHRMPGLLAVVDMVLVRGVFLVAVATESECDVAMGRKAARAGLWQDAVANELPLSLPTSGAEDAHFCDFVPIPSLPLACVRGGCLPERHQKRNSFASSMGIACAVASSRRVPPTTRRWRARRGAFNLSNNHPDNWYRRR